MQKKYGRTCTCTFNKLIRITSKNIPRLHLKHLDSREKQSMPNGKDLLRNFDIALTENNIFSPVDAIIYQKRRCSPYNSSTPLTHSYSKMVLRSRNFHQLTKSPLLSRNFHQLTKSPLLSSKEVTSTCLSSPVISMKSRNFLSESAKKSRYNFPMNNTDPLSKKSKKEKSFDEIEECKDMAQFDDLNILRQKKAIKDIIKAKSNNLNQFHEICNEFFRKKENQVNYLSDIYLVPNFKNHFISYLYNTIDPSVGNMQKLENALDKPTQVYLNTLKLKYQNEKDMKNTKRIPREKKTYLKPGEEIFGAGIIESYEIKNFCALKYDRYSGVDFADDKIKSLCDSFCR